MTTEIPIEIAQKYYNNLITDDVEIVKIGDLTYIRKDKVVKMCIEYNKEFGIKIPDPENFSDLFAEKFQGRSEYELRLAIEGAQILMESLINQNK
jgi:hypothetical protein